VTAAQDEKAIRARDKLAERITRHTNVSAEKAHQMAQKTAQQEERKRKER
jgi:hypothetical protein